MKLISKFKDYYDGMRASDREPDPVYVRESKVFPVHAMDADQRFEAGRLMTSMPTKLWPFERGVLGFCGRLFPFYIVANDVCYDQSQLVKAVGVHRVVVDEDGYDVSLERIEHRLDDLAREWRYLPRRIDDGPFLRFRAPVIWRRESELVTNPILKALQFPSQLDAYSAWQELSMFLGNNLVAAQVTPPRPISDEERAESKGFDRKTSFRNQKNRPKSHRGDW